MVNLKKPLRKRVFHLKKMKTKASHQEKKILKLMIRINQQKNQGLNHRKEEKVNLPFLKH
jgi:hypothetical protein